MLSLVKIKEYLIGKPSVSLSDFAKTFNEDPLFIQQMLSHFIKKGVVVERRLTKHCGSSCQSCPVSNTILYQWCDAVNVKPMQCNKLNISIAVESAAQI